MVPSMSNITPRIGGDWEREEEVEVIERRGGNWERKFGGWEASSEASSRSGESKGIERGSSL